MEHARARALPCSGAGSAGPCVICCCRSRPGRGVAYRLRAPHPRRRARSDCGAHAAARRSGTPCSCYVLATGHVEACLPGQPSIRSMSDAAAALRVSQAPFKPPGDDVLFGCSVGHPVCVCMRVGVALTTNAIRFRSESHLACCRTQHLCPEQHNCIVICQMCKT